MIKANAMLFRSEYVDPVRTWYATVHTRSPTALETPNINPNTRYNFCYVKIRRVAISVVETFTQILIFLPLFGLQAQTDGRPDGQDPHCDLSWLPRNHVVVDIARTLTGAKCLLAKTTNVGSRNKLLPVQCTRSQRSSASDARQSGNCSRASVSFSSTIWWLSSTSVLTCKPSAMRTPFPARSVTQQLSKIKPQLFQKTGTFTLPFTLPHSQRIDHTEYWCHVWTDDVLLLSVLVQALSPYTHENT